MKALLYVVGGFLVLDALVAWLMILVWIVRGQRVDFLELSVYGVTSLLMVALKSVVGPLGAVQLFRLRQSGRIIAAIVVGYNALFAVGAGLRAGAMGGTVWGTMALNLVALAIVLLPAARSACDDASSAPPMAAGRRGRLR